MRNRVISIVSAGVSLGSLVLLGSCSGQSQTALPSGRPMQQQPGASASTLRASSTGGIAPKSNLRTGSATPGITVAFKSHALGTATRKAQDVTSGSYSGVVGQGGPGGGPIELTVANTDGSEVDNCSFSGYPATAVGGYVTTSSSGVVDQPYTSGTGNVLNLYFSAPASGAISATCENEGNTVVSPPAPYSVTAPAFYAAASYGSVSIDSNYDPNPNTIYLHWGNSVIGAGGINWRYYVTGAPVGVIGIFQLVTGSRSATTINGSSAPYVSTGGFPEADGAIPYQNTTVASSSANLGSLILDAPGIALGPPYPQAGSLALASKSFNDQFTDYFMYQPSGGIWVTLAQLSWGWSGSVYDATATKCTQAAAPRLDAVIPPRPTPKPLPKHCNFEGTGSWQYGVGPSLLMQTVATASSTLPQWSSPISVPALSYRDIYGLEW